MGTLVPSMAVPALPGAQKTFSARGDWASFHTRACSRPPLPTTRTRMARFLRTANRTDLPPVDDPQVGCHAHGSAWACSAEDMPTQSRGHGTRIRSTESQAVTHY